MTAHDEDHDRYRLEELLGRGGMGEVWRARDTRLDRAVAIKFLSSGVLDKADRDRFAREARVAAQLTHPNIVAIYDAGDWDDRPYIVMELVSGTTLAEELATHGPFSVEQAVAAAAQVAEGLRAAHAIGVIHRDVKPGNLIRAADDRIQILDFGIARLAGEQATRLTRPGLLVGTAAYSAPEQITMGVADERSDLYALGCVLYELLTGRPPFQGDLATLTYGHVHRAPVPVSELRPGLSAELESLLAALLAKHPSARPPSAADVAAWLRWPVIGARTPAPPAPTTTPTPTPTTTPTHTSVLDSGTAFVARASGYPGGAAPAASADSSGMGEGPDDHGSQRGRRWWFGVVAVSALLAMVLGVVGLVGQWWSNRASDQETNREPAIADTPPSSPSPDPEPEPEPDDGATDTRPPWVRDLEQEMDRLRDAGRLGSETAEDIRDSINEAIEENKPEKAREKLDKLREKLDKRAEKWEKQADEWARELERLPR